MTAQQLLDPDRTTSAAAQWTAPTYSTGAPMVHGDYLPHPQPTQQPALHPLVLQHSEPIQRSNEEDLVMDAQMLREVLQEMPTGQTPVNAQHAAQPRGQQMPGLQLLFASPMHSTDMNAQTHAPTYFTNTMGMTNTSADMLLTMSQTAAPVAPIFQSMQTQDRTSLPGTLPLPAGTIGLTGAFDPLVAGAMVPPPTLPRKKRTTATRICKVEGCTKGIRSRGLCKAHGGGRRCTTPGCTTSDQGGGHCVLHGGGRRCRIEGCKKSAQWRGVCKMHGGARRCRYGNCTKNGQVKQGYCRMHHNLLTAQRQQQEQLQQQQQQLQQMQLPPVPAMPVKLEADAI
uniref:WRKY19-like zinc finger domain-containing protein n=1 Tax=Phytophthora ramorum TaxID=164328 RepID=H3H1G7_PHYRM